MLSQLNQWFDNRTGYKKLLHEALYERVPGGARWRYVWGSTLVFAFVTQLITGVFLWMHYSPSTTTAWESVYYIEHELAGGSFLRGIHHYMAQAMIVLMALHLMQVVIDGAYRAPREINFWTGLILMLLVFGLGLTGYLLPWDQKGYWATQVATKIAGLTPFIGDSVKKLIVGGNEYGHHTLTRFFALHAGVLPGIMIGVLALHLALFRKWGITTPEKSNQQDAYFWPDQVLKDGVACLAVLVTVCFLAGYSRAELGAPADPAEAYNAARPEWYYLFLFQFLKLFHGETGELIGSQIVPGLVFGLLALMPILGKFQWGHRFNVGFLSLLAVGCAGLTAAALYEDFNGKTEKSQKHLAALALAEAEGSRAEQLASSGIPPAGALSLIRSDTKIAGYRLFVRHCATCHSHFDPSGEETDPLRTIKPEEVTASNLFGFGTAKWIKGLLDPKHISGPHYFGNTIHKETDMAQWVQDNLGEELTGEELAARNKNIDLVARALAAPTEKDKLTDADLQQATSLITEEFACTDCHKWGEHGALGSAPDLTDYASHNWLLDFIAQPEQERFYSPDNYEDRSKMMPGFAAHADDPSHNTLTRKELESVVDWLRGEWE